LLLLLADAVDEEASASVRETLDIMLDGLVLTFRSEDQGLFEFPLRCLPAPNELAEIVFGPLSGGLFIDWHAIVIAGAPDGHAPLAGNGRKNGFDRSRGAARGQLGDSACRLSALRRLP
jgi:hypothetical protein